MALTNINKPIQEEFCANPKCPHHTLKMNDEQHYHIYNGIVLKDKVVKCPNCKSEDDEGVIGNYEILGTHKHKKHTSISYFEQYFFFFGKEVEVQTITSQYFCDICHQAITMV